MCKRLILFLLLLISSVAYPADKPISAEKAFHLTATLSDPNTIRLEWHIEEGYYLYKERFFIQPLSTDSISLGHFQWPKAENKQDAQGRDYPIYHTPLTIDLPVLGLIHGQSTILINYQGCADSGFCYPPQSKRLDITFDDNLAAREVHLEDYHLPRAQTPKDTRSALEIVLGQHFIIAVLTFWGFGLLLAFTPCILPMIPVLSGIILGQKKTLTGKQAFLLSGTYVLGMSLCYAAIGIVIALLGANLQAVMQNDVAISLFALLFVALALSMFGFYELQLPTSIQSRFANLSRMKNGGDHLSIFIMGALSTLILSPCVTPPLVGALSYIAHTGNILLGGSALFFLGLGMGTPLLLIGTSLGSFLPKAGYWMNSIKYIIGVLLLAMAILLLERILPGQVTLILWACLFILSGLFMGALHRNAESITAKLWQGVGIVFLVYGTVCIVGVGLGNGNMLQPLKGLSLTQSTQPSVDQRPAVKTVFSLNELNREIKNSEGQAVIVDFYADWCLSCKVLESTVFQDEDVQQVLSKFKMIKADITSNDESAQTLMKQFGVVAPPTLLIFDSRGQLRDDITLIGEFNKAQLLTTLKSL